MKTEGLRADASVRVDAPHPAHAPHPSEPTRLAEFTLTGKRRPRQLALEHENPFCRLAASTAEGAAVCDRGCGIDPSAPCASHTCPFGMLMKPLAQVGEGSTVRWIGRRFASVQAMHTALDQLGAAGIDEEAILEHLPPNPVVSEAELDRTLADRRRSEGLAEEHAPAEPEQNPLALCTVTREAKPAPVSEPNTATAAPATPEGQTQPLVAAASPAPESIHLGDIYEYLTQVNSLIVTARRPSIACDRFLRVLSGMVPFEEMVIYLHDPATGELVLNSTIDHAPAEEGRPRAHATRLKVDGLGETAFKQGRMMIERNGVIEPLSGEADGAGVLAMPLPMRSERTLGVLIATLSGGERNAIFGNEPIRLLGLLAQMLSAQLCRLEETSPAQPEAPHTPHAPQAPLTVPEPQLPARTAEGFTAALRAETARMTRGGTGPACLHVRLSGKRAAEALRKGPLTPELAAALRPFDAVAQTQTDEPAWMVMLATAGPDEARAAARRLTTVLEDALDSRGGMEEMGLRVSIGASVPGVDAAQAEQALAFAREAALAAEALREAPLVLFYGEMETHAHAAVGG